MTEREIQYEEHRRRAVRAYGNQFATGRYRVRLTDRDGSSTFAFRNPRTAIRFFRNRTRHGRFTGSIWMLDAEGVRQEFANHARFASSFGDYSTLVTVMIADTICH